MKTDPVENTAAYLKIKCELEEKIEKEMEARGCGRGLGSCHTYWRIKKRILKNDYGIDWKSPAELNRDVIFD